MPFIIVFIALIAGLAYLNTMRRRNAIAARNAIISRTVEEKPEKSLEQQPVEVPMLPEFFKRFTITFDNEHQAQAVIIPAHAQPEEIIQHIGIQLSPTIFITGGASKMMEEDIQRVREIIDTVAAFAEKHQATILDGGTESGVMHMIGESRRRNNYTFQLVGVSPLGRVSFPGYKNPNEEATLEDSHTHFVLVEGKEWGDESTTLLGLTLAASGNKTYPAVGILINGGQIAKQEVYLAATEKYHLPMIVLDGSGRAADDIATAFKTGRANQKILQAILRGGDIQLVGTHEGPSAVYDKLVSRFSPTS